MKKHLIIAGASGNLGRGVLKALLSKDYDKFYVFVRKSRHIELSDQRITYIETDDFSIEENVKTAFSSIATDKDTVFFLFSSIGGYMGGKPLWENSSDSLQNMLRLNLLPSFHLCRYFSLLVQNSAAGSICLTSALISLRPEINKSIYGLSKSAVNSMVRTLAMEGKAINLSANAIAPYIIDTPENREWVKDMSILIKPEEIGEVVHSLFGNYSAVSGNVVELKQKPNF